jgi:hypothetical protein
MSVLLPTYESASSLKSERSQRKRNDLTSAHTTVSDEASLGPRRHDFNHKAIIIPDIASSVRSSSFYIPAETKSTDVVRFSHSHNSANIMSPKAIKGLEVVLSRDLSNMMTRLSLQFPRCFPLSFFGPYQSLHVLVLAFLPSRFSWLNILVTCQILSVPYCDPLTEICYTSYTTGLGISYRIAISDDNASSDAILQVR